MTRNTYDKAKKNKQSLAVNEAAANAKVNVGNVNTPASKVHTGNNNTHNTVSEREQKKRAEARRRALAHTTPEAVRPRLPAILGFDTRDKFITKTSTAVNKYPILLGVGITLLVTIMCMCVVVNAVDVNRIKLDTVEKENRLEALIETNNELDIALEKRDNAEYYREIAKNQYGMIEKKNVTKHHISIDNEDKIVVVEK